VFFDLVTVRTEQRELTPIRKHIGIERSDTAPATATLGRTFAVDVINLQGALITEAATLACASQGRDERRAFRPSAFVRGSSLVRDAERRESVRSGLVSVEPADRTIFRAARAELRVHPESIAD
jgi:hypothetical protein